MQIPDDLSEQLNAYCSNDLSKVKGELAVREQKLANKPKHSQAQIDSVQAVGKKREETEKTVRRIESELESLKLASTKDREKIDDSIEALAKSVDEKFSRMMDEMGNSGAVELQRTAPSSEDFDIKHYGLRILVKFGSAGVRSNKGRPSNVDMQQLSASVHSGGEKSVSTAIYMMALQELTQVPFRCVDEINQGMDEANERKVWKLLLETAANYSAQYFYLAPKFPHQLDFDGNMRVHFCLSGTLKKRQTQSHTTTESYVRRARRVVEKAKKNKREAP